MPQVIVPLAIGVATAGATAAISSSAQKKAQKASQSLAEQQASEAKVEQQRLEEKFGLTKGELERQDRTFELEAERQAELQRRADLTGEELLREVGPTTRKLLDTVAERQGKTSEELFREEGGGAAGSLLDELSSGDPSDAFKGELELALQAVNQDANRRGVFGGQPEGGIRFENLGRAGVDLAIKASRERIAQQSALANQLFNISSGTRQDAAQLGEQGLTEAAGARGELGGFLSDIQSLNAASKGREAQVALGASGQAQGAINQSFGTQQELLGQQIGESRKLKQEALGTLGNIGGQFVDQSLGKIIGTPVKSSTVSEIGQAREEDPLTRLGALRGR